MKVRRIKGLAYACTLGLLTLLAATTATAQVETIAQRPYYDLNVTLEPARGMANGAVLIKYVNTTGEDLYNIAVAMENPTGNTRLVSRARINRRNADVVYKFKDQGDPYTGFELQGSRRMPPDVVSEVEIHFTSFGADTAYGLTVYTGDWIPKVLGPADSVTTDPERPIMDYDATVAFPIDWRGAMSGLSLREDGRGNTVEIFNGAANVVDYGVAVGQNLLIDETDVYGIRLRVFYPEGEERWAQAVMNDTRHVLEYIKRYTPFRPPLVLNVLPGGRDLEGARPMYANTIAVHMGGPTPGTMESRIAVAHALMGMYWGFGGTDKGQAEVSGIENALLHYGVQLYADQTSVSDEWLEDLRARYDAGLLARHHPAIGGPVELVEMNGVPWPTGGAQELMAMRLLEGELGRELMERIYHTTFERHRLLDVTADHYLSVVAELAEGKPGDVFQRWLSGEGMVDARVAYSENRGILAGRYVIEVGVQREGSPRLAIPVAVDQTTGARDEAVLDKDRTSHVFRTEGPPADVLIDPDRTLPLYSHALINERAVTLVAASLARNHRWQELLDLMRDVRSRGVTATAGVLVHHGLALAYTGEYTAADLALREVPVDADQAGRWMGELYLARGKVADLLGRRQEALENYRNAMEYGPGITEEASGYVQRAYTQNRE